MKALKLISLLLIVSSYSFGQNHTTKKNHTDIWSNASAWATGGVPNTSTNNLNITINGYITTTGNLIFKNSTTLNINDTLVVTGTLEFENTANFNIQSEGLVIVLGDYISKNKANVGNGGKFIVKGQFELKNNNVINNNGEMFLFDPNPDLGNGSTISGQAVKSPTQLQSKYPYLYGFVVGTFSTLPIQMDKFTGTASNNQVKLNFSTLSEENFDYFTIERATDAKNYEEIGTIKGSGWSQSKKEYTFTDERPLPGVNYYRLKAVDFDGYTEYFAPISVFNNDVQLKVATLVGDNQLRIFSNLSAEARIYNLQGLPVHSGAITSGVNDINLPATVSGGYYVVGIYAGNELVKKEKVLVQ